MERLVVNQLKLKELLWLVFVSFVNLFYFTQFNLSKQLLQTTRVSSDAAVKRQLALRALQKEHEGTTLPESIIGYVLNYLEE